MSTAETLPDVVPAAEKSLLRDYTETILVCVIFVVFSRAFVFQQSKIPSGSMMDSLLVGDYIMVNRFVYAPSSFGWERSLLPERQIRRGDVVVFKYPSQPDIDYIKRVVGLPGDRVELRDGRLYVNDRPIDEPYVKEAYRQQDEHKNYGPVEVLPDHYLVFGDHRDRSADSRVWGQVHRDLMKGRALLIWWSFEENEGGGPYMPLGERLRAWGDKALHFFGKSRWSRCFRIIR
ncbi:MAG TPA: signal peptidase I [Candidatus Polarisedimenticolaceae bacterium]|nr:signal peptidase I [Candidatus Polarisedimenticolaceae bacterium]